MSLLEVILVDYRWVFVCLFLLPASFLYNLVWFVRNWILLRWYAAPAQHDRRVGRIIAAVKEWNRNYSSDVTGSRANWMCTDRPGWQTMSFRVPRYKSLPANLIPCRQLVNILHLEHADQSVPMWIRCEPMCTIGELTKYLDQYELTLPVIPELDDLTIGGLIMGAGIESSSHKYGLFAPAACRKYEIVMANGDLVECTKDMNADLFAAIPWSHGTLGFLVSCDLLVIPSKKWIKLDYRPVYCNNSGDSLIEPLKQVLHDAEHEFVEMLVYDLNTAILMTGNYVDVQSVDRQRINRIGKWYKPWFYTHAKTYLRHTATPLPSSLSFTEYLPARDYFHRHTRSLFWELNDIIPFGNAVPFRLLLGWLMPVKVSLLKLTQTATIKRLYEENHYVQDLLVPIDAVARCLNELHTTIGVYPLWLCPAILNAGDNQFLNGTGQFVDIGIYGVPQPRSTTAAVPKFNAYKSSRQIERFVLANNGFQLLYADTFLTRDEFRQMFNHRLYDGVRKQYNIAHQLPEIYEKIRREARD